MPAESDPLIPVDDAAARLGVSVETVLRYARSRRWRKIKGNDGVLVAVPPDMLSGPPKPALERAPPAPAIDPTALVQAAVAPLQAALERSDGDRRILQAQADALRVELAAAQVERAEAVGVANAATGRREEIEKRLADALARLEALSEQAKRRWWHIFR